jgi:hypothetical protein
MIARFASLVLDTMDGLRWLLPGILVAVTAVVLVLDGHVILRGLRQRERFSAGSWLTDNFWILVGSALALYVMWHYPRDPW